LFSVVLVEEQMELIKSWPCDLPMRFFVEIAKGHGVGQHEVELLGHFEANRLFQFERQEVRNGAIGLNFGSTLVKAGLGV